MNFAPNLTTIFTEVPFIQRFKKAREHRFSFVECQFPYSFSIEEIQEELEQNKLSLVLINLPPGNWENGDRGISVDPERKLEFRDSVQKGIDYATALKCPKIHCMAGIVPDSLDIKKAKETYKENLKYAAKEMAKHEITLLIEPINTFDIPRYFLSSIKEAVEIIEEINLPNIKLQYDFYHMQRIQGNLLATFKNYFSMIGHIQIADVPGRNEPETGEINYKNIFKIIKESNYQGFIGLEYTPLGKSEESFSWLKGEE